jgi:hypothetical protein
VGELYRDGLPDLFGRVIRKQGLSLDSLSKEYLNYEFGWKPFVSDLAKLAHIVIDSKRVIDQYVRDSGRPIVRKMSFPTIRATKIVDLGQRPSEPSLSTWMYAGSAFQGPCTQTDESSTDLWFSGVYSYFLELGDDSRSRLEYSVSMAEKLLGFEITPGVLWNLGPWTWLVDWFVNIGDVFTNISAFSKDGLIMRRGYIMCESKNSRTYDLQKTRFVDWPQSEVISQTFVSHTKLRKPAYPFGFGLTVPTFTPRQIAILAALGITQGSRVGR